MNEPVVERHENPHVTRGPGPLLARHPFQPPAFLVGLALVSAGGTFLAHQLGVIELGPVPTLILGVVVVAAVLIDIAFAWTSRNGAPPAPSPDHADTAESHH